MESGQTVTLMWTVSDVLEREIDVVITPDIGLVDVSGSITISPTETTTYTLTATNVDGDTSASVTITVASIEPAESAAVTGIVDGDDENNAAGAAGSSETADYSWLRYALLSVLLAAAVSVIIVLAARKKPRPDKNSGVEVHYATDKQTEIRMPLTVPAAGAKLMTDDGEIVPLSENTGHLGRQDFRSMVMPGKADMISRQHIHVNCEKEGYFIEDSSSTNGTKVNGLTITGKGRHLLKYNDIIDLAGVLTLTFKAS